MFRCTIISYISADFLKHVISIFVLCHIRQKGILMNFIELMTSKRDSCDESLFEIERKIAALPEGELRCYRNGKYFNRFRIMPDGSKILIPKSNTELACDLAYKMKLLEERDKLLAERNGCQAYIDIAGAIHTSSNEEIDRLLSVKNSSSDEKVLSWADRAFKKSDKFPEKLRIRTIRGDMVRSKLEAMTANILYRLGLPYRYEQVYDFDDTSFAPDFTVLDVRTDKEILIECCGMMERPEYRENFIRKINTYIKDGRTLGVDLLMFFEDDANKLDEATVESQLRHFFL